MQDCNFTWKLLILILMIIIIILLIIGYIGYKWFLNNYYNYTNITTILKKILGNQKYFMNYGYWKHEAITLSDANIELCNYIYEKGNLSKSVKILDVGCGHGEQDVYWAQKTKASIECIDIEEESIKNAKKIIVENNLLDRITPKIGDACKLSYKDNSFDTIISLESAFHYENREFFFKKSYDILEKGGTFIVADIVLNKDSQNFVNKIYKNMFIQSFHIPKSNLIHSQEYVKQLETIGFKCELYDITKYTFTPYYKNFFRNLENGSMFFNTIKLLGNVMINHFCDGTTAFDYIVVVCKK